MNNPEYKDLSQYMAYLASEVKAVYRTGELPLRWQLLADYREVPGMVHCRDIEVPSPDEKFPTVLVRLLSNDAPIANTTAVMPHDSSVLAQSTEAAMSASFEYHVAVQKQYCRYRQKNFIEIKDGSRVIGFIRTRNGVPFHESKRVQHWNSSGRKPNQRPIDGRSLGRLLSSHEHGLEAAIKADTVLYPPRAARIFCDEQTGYMDFDLMPMILDSRLFDMSIQRDVTFRNKSWDSWRTFWRAVIAYFQFSPMDATEVVPRSLYSDAEFYAYVKKADLSALLRQLMATVGLPEQQNTVYEQFAHTGLSRKNVVTVTPTRSIASIETTDTDKEFWLQVLGIARWVTRAGFFEAWQRWIKQYPKYVVTVMLEPSDPHASTLAEKLTQEYGASQGEALDAILAHVIMLQITFDANNPVQHQQVLQEVARLCVQFPHQLDSN